MADRVTLLHMEANRHPMVFVNNVRIENCEVVNVEDNGVNVVMTFRIIDPVITNEHSVPYQDIPVFPDPVVIFDTSGLRKLNPKHRTPKHRWGWGLT